MFTARYALSPYIKQTLDVCLSVLRCICVEKKNQLDNNNNNNNNNNNLTAVGL